MEWLFNPEAWIALATLTALEVVLGIDNIVFISILAGKLPEEKRAFAMRAGLALAFLSRVALLASIAWLAGLTAPLFEVIGNEISGRDLILIVGGLFLLTKSTREIHEKVTHHEREVGSTPAKLTLRSALVQIMLLDVVFSFDSVITAIGMANDLWVMITAVLIAIAFMMAFAGPVQRFVEGHPTVQMLALSFLLLIGMALVADGLDRHIPKGYIYFAMGFSVFVEALNLGAARRRRGASEGA